jgi:hypothetical protein
MEEDPREEFCEVICFIDGGINPFEDNKIALNPFA